jgi:hypothetical protein
MRRNIDPSVQSAPAGLSKKLRMERSEQGSLACSDAAKSAIGFEDRLDFRMTPGRQPGYARHLA